MARSGAALWYTLPQKSAPRSDISLNDWLGCSRLRLPMYPTPALPLQLHDLQRNSEQCGSKHSPDPQRQTNAFDLRKAALNRTDGAFELPDVALNS